MCKPIPGYTYLPSKQPIGKEGPKGNISTVSDIRKAFLHHGALHQATKQGL